MSAPAGPLTAATGQAILGDKCPPRAAVPGAGGMAGRMGDRVKKPGAHIHVRSAQGRRWKWPRLREIKDPVARRQAIAQAVGEAKPAEAAPIWGEPVYFWRGSQRWRAVQYLGPTTITESGWAGLSQGEFVAAPAADEPSDLR